MAATLPKRGGFLFVQPGTRKPLIAIPSQSRISYEISLGMRACSLFLHPGDVVRVLVPSLLPFIQMPTGQALEIQVYQAILERQPAPVIPRLKEILAKPDPSLGFFNGELAFD